MGESYARYVKGLRMIESTGYAPLEPCRNRKEWELARSTIDSLEGAAIAAGANTWREAKERYRRARAVFEALPTPCRATLYTVEPCPELGFGGICATHRKTVKTVMHHTCQRYGIALD